jgi:hypothetical protein
VLAPILFYDLDQTLPGSSTNPDPTRFQQLTVSMCPLFQLLFLFAISLKNKGII